MLPQTFTHSGYTPTNRHPRSWQNYLSRLVALVALIGGLGASQDAWGQEIYDDGLTLTQQPTTGAVQSYQYAGLAADPPYSNYPRLGNASASPAPPSPRLGTYDLNGTSQLVITGGSIAYVNSKFANRKAVAGHLLYKVYITGTSASSQPGFSSVNLADSGTNSNGDLAYSTNSASVDLLSGLTSGGNYIVEVVFEILRADGSTLTDPSSSYTLTFTVKPPAITPPGGTTIWQGIARGTGSNNTAVALPADQDWFNTSNWSNGVPTYQSDAIIPEKSNALIVYPVLNNPAATYEVRNLTLQGAQSQTASKVTIGSATLRLYGNFSQESDPGLVGNTTNNPGVTDASQNSTIILAGADQIISGSILISDLIVAGSGTKSIIEVPVSVSNILSFQPASVSDGVIMQSALQRTVNSMPETVFSTNGRTYVQLLSTGKISNVIGQAETNVSYIKGVSRADRQLTSATNGRRSDFGNIGLEISANHDINNLIVYRVVGTASLGPAGSSAVPTKRQYQVTGDDSSNNTATAGSTVDVVFHYLDSGPNTSANELNGIDENNLTMYRTIDNGPPYQSLGGTVNTVNNTVTQTGIPSLLDYKLVLGDKTNPLPVSLVAFGAVRSGANTLLTWTTASEERNTGFNVQVSTDGANFRTLSFVASQSPNSSTTLNYKYTDTEAGKTGARYYRLEQVDEGGAKNYSPVRLVNFSAAAAGTGVLVAYPNPFNEGVSLSLDGSTIADGTALVRLIDMTGRTVRESKLPLVGASLTLSDMSALRSGLYLAKVTLPDGSTQTVRISKQ